MRRSVTDQEVQRWIREAQEARKFPGLDNSIPGAREKVHIRYGNVHYGKGRGGPHIGINTPEGTAHLYRKRVYVGDKNFGRGRKLNEREAAMVSGLMDEMGKIKKKGAVPLPVVDVENEQHKAAFNALFDGGLRGALIGGASGAVLGGGAAVALHKNPRLAAAILGALTGGVLFGHIGAHLGKVGKNPYGNERRTKTAALFGKLKKIASIRPAT